MQATVAIEVTKVCGVFLL